MGRTKSWRRRTTELAVRLHVSLTVNEDSVTDDTHEDEIVASTTDKNRFVATQTHEMVVRGITLAATYQDLYERLSYGVEPCINPDCDVCHDL